MVSVNKLIVDASRFEKGTVGQLVCILYKNWFYNQGTLKDHMRMNLKFQLPHTRTQMMPSSSGGYAAGGEGIKGLSNGKTLNFYPDRPR